MCSVAYAEHCARVEAGVPTGMDAYGATNEAEFFAVATEVFFEKPKQMRRELPELYEILRKFYNLDLAARMDRRVTIKDGQVVELP